MGVGANMNARTRKRRWDQDDQGQTAVVVKAAEAEKAEVEPPLSAISEIAAKIKASISAKTGLDLPTAEDDAPKTLEMKKEEKSLLETFGIDPAEKTVKKAKAEEAKATEVLDINDTKHRYYLTKESTQEMLENEFKVTIVTKGKYYPDRRMATEKDPPLCLEVFGEDEEAVGKAIARMEEIVEKGPPEPVSSHTAQNSFSVEKIFIDIEPSDAVPAFTIRGKILGPQGSFLKHIQSQTGCKVHLRGRGSGYVDLAAAAGSEEVSEGLHLHISGMRREDVEGAKRLAEDLITHVKKDVDGLNAAAMRPPMPLGYSQMPYNPYYGYSMPPPGQPPYPTPPQGHAYSLPPTGQPPYYPPVPGQPDYFSPVSGQQPYAAPPPGPHPPYPAQSNATGYGSSPPGPYPGQPGYPPTYPYPGHYAPLPPVPSADPEQNKSVDPSSK